MKKNRLEAFSDGVIAILITIMVLELKAPHGSDLKALVPLVPTLLSYLLSFVYLGIYWNNHHHMLHATEYVTGGILWTNLNLLFWLSLVPFATAWMGENHFESGPVALYGIILLGASLAYWLLQYFIVCTQGKTSLLKTAIGVDVKGKISPVLYLFAIGFAFIEPRVSGLLYVGVALMWLIPDRRIEKVMANEKVHRC
jgi:uncharacterized membrane protein